LAFRGLRERANWREYPWREEAGVGDIEVKVGGVVERVVEECLRLFSGLNARLTRQCPDMYRD
jgi:hypothetical protein